MRILVAQDDEALGNFVRLGLEAEHYAVDVSASEAAAVCISSSDSSTVPLSSAP